MTNNVANVAGASVQCDDSSCVLKAVYVMKANAGDKIDLINGSADGDPVIFSIQADTAMPYQNIDVRFPNGLRIKPTGSTARYVAVFG